uniref:Uncharacterized protein n=1 Tax=Oryza rufipogon TaxID=4529 RepID=A0A0E0R3Q6_ORYRU
MTPDDMAATCSMKCPLCPICLFVPFVVVVVSFKPPRPIHSKDFTAQPPTPVPAHLPSTGGSPSRPVVLPCAICRTNLLRVHIYQKENKGAVTVTSTFRAFRHAEQPALRTLLAPEKRLLVRSGTEDWTEAYNLFKEQGIKDLVVNVK